MGGNTLQGEICSGINYKRKMLKFKLQIPQNARSYGSTLTSKCVKAGINTQHRKSPSHTAAPRGHPPACPDGTRAGGQQGAGVLTGGTGGWDAHPGGCCHWWWCRWGAGRSVAARQGRRRSSV